MYSIFFSSRHKNSSLVWIYKYFLYYSNDIYELCCFKKEILSTQKKSFIYGNGNAWVNSDFVRENN